MHRRPLARLIVLLLLLVTVCVGIQPTTVMAQSPNGVDLTVIHPYLSQETIFVAWIDMSKLNVPEVTQLARGLRVPNITPRGEAFFNGIHASLTGAGVTRIYAVGTLEQWLQQNPLIVAPANQPQAVVDVVRGLQPPANQTVAIDGKNVLMGTREAMERAKSHPGSPTDRLTAALRTVHGIHGGVFVPSPDVHALVRTMPTRKTTNEEMTLLRDALVGMESITLELDLPLTQGALRATFDRADVAAAIAAPVGQWVTKQWGEQAQALQPQLQERQLVWQVTSAEQGQRLIKLIVTPIRQKAIMMEELNHVKQVNLGLVNYESTMGKFPPQALVDAKGQRLLSWRVLLLPYIGQEKLYARFHLDEPWDSSHNKSLLGEMPDIFRAAMGSDIPTGKTPFLAPLIENSLMGRTGAPARVRHVKDGTSKTVWVVRVPDEAAVDWTKPEDWTVPNVDPLKTFQAVRERFAAGRLDGSALMLRSNMKPEMFRALLTVDGGEAIDKSQL